MLNLSVGNCKLLIFNGLLVKYENDFEVTLSVK